MKLLKLSMNFKDLQHQFHTSMTVILGMAHLLTYENLTASQSDMLNDLKKAAEQLSDFIDNQILINYSEERETNYFEHIEGNKGDAQLFIKLIENRSG